MYEGCFAAQEAFFVSVQNSDKGTFRNVETLTEQVNPNENVKFSETQIANNVDAPYACKAGVCSTCRAKVLEGEVEMITNHALEDYEVDRGYVLTCQCLPISDNVVFDYDQ